METTWVDDSIVEKFISLTCPIYIYISNFVVLNRPCAPVFSILIDRAISWLILILLDWKNYETNFEFNRWKKIGNFFLKRSRAKDVPILGPFQHLISVSRNFPTSIRFIFSFFHSIEPGRGGREGEISLGAGSIEYSTPS